MEPYELDDQLRPVLGPNERLLWSGRPRQGVIFRGSDLLQVPFSLLWCGFAIFWERSALTTNAPLFFKLWGIPFVGIGLYMVIGRFFVDALIRARTIYGLTNERALIVGGLLTNSTRTVSLATLSDINLLEGSDGRGTIILGPAPFGGRFVTGSPWPGTASRMPAAFEQIEDVRAVESRIRSAQAQLRAPA